MADTPFDREVERNFRWNFSVNLLDISFIMLGLNLVSRETVLPLLLSKLTSSPVAIGLAPAIYSLGIYLPYLLAGLAVLLLAEPAPAAALAAVALFLGISARRRASPYRRGST